MLYSSRVAAVAVGALPPRSRIERCMTSDHVLYNNVSTLPRPTCTDAMRKGRDVWPRPVQCRQSCHTPIARPSLIILLDRGTGRWLRPIRCPLASAWGQSDETRTANIDVGPARQDTKDDKRWRWYFLMRNVFSILARTCDADRDVWLMGQLISLLILPW